MADGFIKAIKKGKKEFKNCSAREVEILVEEVEENNPFILVPHSPQHWHTQRCKHQAPKE